MKLNRRIDASIRILLPVIFIAYAVSIHFFYHTHIVNGVTIVHSHPYKTDGNGNPAHEHSGTELQLIHALSSFHTLACVLLCLLPGFFPLLNGIVSVGNDSFLFQSCPDGLCRLRPPPVA